jgi:outer membrane protein assembly factor BamC
MKSITFVPIFSLLFLLNLSACSYIKTFFPDKEKDYQLTSEIPDLVIPSDLTGQSIPEKSVTAYQQAGYLDEEESRPVNTVKDNAIAVDLVEFSGGATRIRIEDTLTRSWRTVGKALSHHSIEIIDRNEIDGVFYVQYDPDFKKVEDGSLWDEVLFIFGSDPAKEKEFMVRLAENGGMTEVIVLDTNDIPLSKGTGLKLLNLLYKTIKDDLSNIK